MKIIVSLSLGLLLFTFAGSSVLAQHRKLTVILLRHAEKDVSEEADTANPGLSAEGKLRAQRLVKIINKYNPDAIYSTNYIRTRATVMPLARSRRAMIFIYDPRNLNQMVDLIMSGKLKRIVVVGHSNTTPELANLLIKQDKYKTLDESEYDKIWVIKIKRNKRKPNKIREKVITY
ncbi:MAG: histidine phosphatase family protein [Acidobacteria bacterium]|nr:histidine phosphatase family protein [Acidobacteriota bacterium]MCA1637696.1 histidine phosphatase family protein [Acidobacteriota bacterium]